MTCSLDILWVLGGWGFRVRVRRHVGYYFNHSASLTHHKAESHGVFNFGKMADIEDLAGYLYYREDFLGMTQDLKMDLIT